MAWGMATYDDQGNLIFDGSLLLHRVWHFEVVDTPGTITYDEPLYHEPTVVIYAINSIVPHSWAHIISGGQWVGLEIDYPLGMFVDESLVVVLARE